MVMPSATAAFEKETDMRSLILPAALLLASIPASAQPVPAAVAAPGERVVDTLHAEGAQVYECKADAQGRLVWTFREPVATLIRDGRTVGRHYAGPHWELDTGDLVAGRVTGRAPGATPADIPLLRLEVTTRRGGGPVGTATTIQRLATQGGALEGPCERAGAFRSVAYVTTYVFLRRE
jgi:hypothetical protein